MTAVVSSAHAMRVAVAVCAAVVAAGARGAEEQAASLLCPSGKVASYKVREGEVRRGDSYLLARTITVDGTHDGDLITWTQSLTVGGNVTGDLVAGFASANLTGTIEDSVRLFGQSARVDGTIDGDLLAFAQSIVIGPHAHITGNMLTFGQEIIMNGRVDGFLQAGGGEVMLGGIVGKDATVKCDALTIDPEARIRGDLEYKARNRLDLDGKGIVGGAIRYEERKKKGEEDEEGVGMSIGGVLTWLWAVAASLVVGLVGLALFREAAPRIADTAGGDALRSLGVGFVAAIVLPVAAILICLLVITIPLAVLALLLYLVAVYVAKLPVAVWLGGRLLRLAGRASPSPVAGLLLGVPLLYLVFRIPYLGTLAWLLCLFVGLGAIVLGARARTEPRTGPAPTPASL